MTRAHLITGSFGSGKTTVIRRMMAAKPAAELWVVVLNEFTDAGIDALSVASSARGAYDVRLVAGGCLCCVGEIEFGKQLRDILRNLKPQCLLIEPSGAGHAADIVDVLGEYQAHGALQLDSVVCLVDALDAAQIEVARPQNEWSQIQAADALLLSKPDLASAAAHEAFAQIVAAQYPAKQLVGACSFGELPAQALGPFERGPSFSPLRNPAESAPKVENFDVQGWRAVETSLELPGHHALQWHLPAQLTFARPVLEARLGWMGDAYAGYLVRMKGVFRTGPGPSALMQSTGHGLTIEDSAWRHDSRLELVLRSKPDERFVGAWRALLRAASNP